MDNLVSAVLVAFNEERNVQRSVNSLLNQSYDSMQLVLVDNGSTDSTFQLLQNFAHANANIITTSMSKNTVLAWYRGILMTNGSYVFMAAADDYWEPDFVESLVLEMEQSGAGLAIGDMSYESERGEVRKILKFSSLCRDCPEILEKGGAGNRARLSTIVNKYFPSTEYFDGLNSHVAPDLFYALYRGEPLRSIAKAPWLGYDDRFAFAEYSYQVPWTFVNRVLHRRIDSNAVPSNRPSGSCNPFLVGAEGTNPLMRKERFLRKLLLRKGITIWDKIGVIFPLWIEKFLLRVRRFFSNSI